MRRVSGFAQIIIVAIIALTLGAVGLLAYQKFSAKPIPIPSPVTTQSPTSDLSPETQMLKDKTASWKTFSNQEIGVSFQYPPKAEVSVIDKCLTANCIGKGIRFFYFSGKIDRKEAFFTHLSEGLVMDISQIDVKSQPLKDTLSKLHSKPRMSEGPLKELKTITLNGAEGYKASADYSFSWLADQGTKTSSGTSEEIYVNSKNRNYSISATYTGKDVVDYEKIYNQILSTFKFLE